MVSTPEGLAVVLTLKTKRHAHSPIRGRGDPEYPARLRTRRRGDRLERVRRTCSAPRSLRNADDVVPSRGDRPSAGAHGGDGNARSRPSPRSSLCVVSPRLCGPSRRTVAQSTLLDQRRIDPRTSHGIVSTTGSAGCAANLLSGKVWFSAREGPRAHAYGVLGSLRPLRKGRVGWDAEDSRNGSSYRGSVYRTATVLQQGGSARRVAVSSREDQTTCRSSHRAFPSSSAVQGFRRPRRRHERMVPRTL
jgi:hypothetical protein